MKNWIVALFALALGGAVTVALLVLGNPARGLVNVYAATRDVPAGAIITRDLVHAEAVLVPDGTSSFFTTEDGSQLVGLRAGHDLAAGQLIQRGDVIPLSATPDERLVFIPVKDAPPAAPGARLDLLLVGGTVDRPDVVPFALGVEVRAVVTGGFIIAIPSRKASAFVYAAEVMRLVAVIGAPDSAVGSESPVGAPDEAQAIASQP